MLRSQAPRSLFRSFHTLPKKPIAFQSNSVSALPVQSISQLCTLGARRPQLCAALRKFEATTQIRSSSQFDKIDIKHEVQVAKEKLKATPETVSATSSIHPFNSELGQKAPEETVHSHGSIAGDFQTIKDTFDLSEVPREAYVLGLAGLMPYLATSLSTLGVAFEINHAHEHGSGYFMTSETAHNILTLLEPVQVGYGAVIISFLGAIHWGLEWANYGGKVGYPRYAIGVLAPAIAWPSILLPVEYALIAQFFAFNVLYYADTRACRRGWAPAWYGTYRFVLTFIVGATIVVSLIGRGELIGRVGHEQSPGERMKSLQDAMYKSFSDEEAARTKGLVKDGKARAEEKDSADDDSEDDGVAEGKDSGDDTGKKNESHAGSTEKKDKAIDGVEKASNEGESRGQGGAGASSK